VNQATIDADSQTTADFLLTTDAAFHCHIVQVLYGFSWQSDWHCIHIAA
jgi:hypothetical protein